MLFAEMTPLAWTFLAIIVVGVPLGIWFVVQTNKKATAEREKLAKERQERQERFKQHPAPPSGMPKASGSRRRTGDVDDEDDEDVMDILDDAVGIVEDIAYAADMMSEPEPRQQPDEPIIRQYEPPAPDPDPPSSSYDSGGSYDSGDSGGYDGGGGDD